MYTDFYLKFDSEAQAQSVLYTEVPTKWDDEGNVLETEPRANYANIDVLGILYEHQEIPDPENPPPPIPIPGFHVNVRVMEGEDAEALVPFQVNPEPMVWRRVWG
jgi:hypothetical protein